MKHTKKLFAVLLSALMLLSCIPFAASAEGEPATPTEPTDWIEIYTYEDLDDVRYDLTANYKLMNDIDMTEWVKPGGDYDYYGQGWNPIGSKNIYADDAFTGIFDGNGHTISGMRMNVTKFPSGTGNIVYFGLFARVSGTVRNLTVAGSITVDDRNFGSYYNYAGGIAAFLNETGLIENCTNRVKLNVSGKCHQYVGGVVGCGYGTVKNCRNIASVYAYASSSYYSYAAGILGIGSTDAPHPGNTTSTLKAKVYNCVNSGDVTAKGGLYEYAVASGIANYVKEVHNCYNVATIKTEQSNTGSSNYTAFNNGIAHNSYVYNCYNIGSVPKCGTYSNNYNYAITGYGSTNCFYLKGSGITSTGAVEKTDAQLKRQIQFTGWDFENVWTMEGRDDYFYPELRDVALLTPDDLKTPITGAIKLDGEAAADAVLTVNTAELLPANATVSYSWKIDDAVVSTAKTYTVKTEDLGKTLVLTVTGTGNYKGELTLTRVLGEAHQHTEEIIPGTLATCTQSGLTDGKKCSECGEILVPQEVIPAKGHTEVVSPAVPATCLEAGSTEGRVCSACGEVIALQTEIPALGHKEQTHHTDATCSQVGYDITFCARCGETLNQTITPPTNHSWNDGEVTKDATCTENGMVTYTCTVCGATKTEPTDMLAHNWNDGEVTKEPSCTEAGVKTYTCSVGGETRTEPVDKLDHNLVLVPGTPATCTEAGLSDGWQCESCGKWILPQQTIDATGHNPVTDPAVAATCTATGLTEGSHCDICGTVFVEQQETEKLAHTPDAPVTENEFDATCTEPGGYDEVVYCAVCGEELSREEKTIEALGHKMVQHEGKNPTCTEPGWAPYEICERCEYSTYEELEAPGHNPGDVVIENVKDASCSVPGSFEEVYYCTVCGEEMWRDLVEGQTLPHTPGEVKIENEVAATCTAKGSYDEVIYCTVCDEVISRETINTDKLDHNLVLVPGKAATCSKAGLSDGWKCETCGKVFAEQKTIAKLAHTPGEAVRENETPASCKAEGSFDEVIRCTECGEELSRETKTIAKLAHTPGEAVRENEKAASCKAEGSFDEVIRCTVCGEELSRESKTIDKLAHTPGDAVRENIVEATVDVGGSYDEVVYCTFCHEELSRETVATDPLTHTHNYVAETTKEATCSEDGETTYTCSVCGDSYTETIPATGNHVDKNNDGKCDTCGEKMTGGKHCKYCGKIHGGAFGWLTSFFHSILAIFKR